MIRSGEHVLFEAHLDRGSRWTRAQYAQAMLVASGMAAQMAENMRKLHAATSTSSADVARLARMLDRVGRRP